LFRAFSVHLKHQTVPRLSIAETLQEVGDLKRFLEGTVSTVQTNLSLKSVQMIYNQRNRLDDKLKSTTKDIHVDLLVCLTTQVENLHAVGHFKDQCATSLNYSRNMGNTVYESIKRITSWAAYYFTHPTSYYPIPDSSIPLKHISKLSHLGKTRHLNSTQEQIMREWAVQHSKCV